MITERPEDEWLGLSPREAAFKSLEQRLATLRGGGTKRKHGGNLADGGNSRKVMKTVAEPVRMQPKTWEESFEEGRKLWLTLKQEQENPSWTTYKKKKRIMKDSSDEVEIVEVPKRCIAKIIGVKGAMVASIAKMSGANVNARDQSTDPVRVIVTGSSKATEDARDMILALVGAATHRYTTGKVLEVHMVDIGKVIGYAGTTINEIQSTTGAKLDVNKDCDPCTVRITGDDDKIAEAEKIVWGLVAGAEDVSQASQMGSIFTETIALIDGSGLAVLEYVESLQTEFGVMMWVDCEENKAEIKGHWQAVQSAKDTLVQAGVVVPRARVVPQVVPRSGRVVPPPRAQPSKGASKGSWSKGSAGGYGDGGAWAASASQAAAEEDPEFEPTLWRYDPVASGCIMTIRKLPRIDAPGTGEFLERGDEFFVSQELRDKRTGVIFLKLLDGRGWVFDSKPGVGQMCVRSGVLDQEQPDPPKAPDKYFTRGVEPPQPKVAP